MKTSILGQMTIENNSQADASAPVVVSLHVKADPERVWRSLIDSNELAAWYWPAALQPRAAVDPRTGGSYRISAASPRMAVSGEYVEFAPPQRLAMTWRWDGDEYTSTVTISLVPADGGTKLQVIHEGLAAEAVAAHRQGWSDCLSRLPAHLAGDDPA